MSPEQDAAGDALVELEIADEAWSAAVAEPLEPLAEEAARAALAAIGIDAAALAGAPSIAILLTDDAAIADLNARFRGKPEPTNVLSWPAHDWTAPASWPDLAAALPRSGGHIGDVALALGVLQREANVVGKSLEDHIRHLIVHGVLHLLGYDHQDEEQAALMEARERAALAALGVADPYASEGVVPGGDG